MCLLVVPSALSGGATPTITSDLPDYNPGQTVTLTGSNWDPSGGDVHIVVNDSVGATWTHSADVAPSSSGDIVHSFALPATFIAQYSVQATQGPLSASTTFTDANPSADLDQCANDPLPSPSTDGCSAAAADWVNGNLGESKTVYFEGDSIPYRLKFGDLAPGGHSVTIEWDTTKGGKHALDYITTFNRTVSTANPCLGVAGCDPLSFSSFAIPADPQVAGAGVTQIAGNLRLYGGTITGIAGPPAYTYADGPGFLGDKSARMTIQFTASVPNPVLAWGGHISTRADWGLNGSAVAISGSPYHTRLINLDGSGGNQDRSLSAAAVIFPGSITVVKQATPEGSASFGYTASPSPLTNFALVDDGTSANTKVFSNITNFQTYTVNESSVPANWGFDSVLCGVTSPNGGSSSTSTTTASIAMKEGENWTCTYQNSQRVGTLIVKKHVINDNGGTKTASDFTLHAKSAGSDVAGSPAAGSESGVSYTLGAGPYVVSENAPPAGYTETGFSGDCDSSGNVTVVVGQTKTCTITNNDNAPKLTLNKVVVNDNGGTAAESAWTLTATGNPATNPASLSGAGAAGNADVVSGAGFDAGSYDLSESAGPAGYTASDWSCTGGQTGNEAKVVVGLGDDITCTITNNDRPGTIIVKKITKPINANTSFAFETTGTDYSGFSLGDGQQNSQTLNAGSYTVKELVPLGWILTGIGGSTDPNTPFNCTVTGSGGSTGVGSLATQTATISLKNGDTVTCVFENTGQGVTRTQGFWSTHPQLANIAWFGGTAFGHTFPGVAATAGIGDTLICGRSIDTLGKLMGSFWSSIAKKTTGAKRTALDQSRMQLLQQLIAAELNASAFGSVPSSGSFATWETKLCGTNMTAINNATSQAASFNTAGDSGTFTPGTSADSKTARSIANKVFWNIIKP